MSSAGPVDGTFTEVADRVWVARHAWYDVNVTAVGGARGLLVLDTHASQHAGACVVEAVRGLGAGEVVAVVNSHAHHDHVLGNGAFRAAWPDVPIHAHEAALAALPGHLGDVRREAEARPASDEHREELLASTAVLPDRTFSSVAVIDLGDRAVELVHPGRGHTDGDLVARVADADVVLAGDLVEASDAGDAVPGLGADSWPLEWPLTLDLVLQLLSADTVVVPGHGPLMDREQVRDQRADLGVVAETIRDLAGRGVPQSQALDSAEWPFPTAALGDAVRLAYAHLPRAQKRLPLV